MWYDEWFTWHISTQGLLGLVTRTAQDVHPPLYYAWVWLWMQWTGSDHLLIMRLSSAIPALLTVAFVYRVGRDWFRSAWAGSGAALFLACSGFFIYYARELRMYTLLVLLMTISWWLLYRFVHEKRGAGIGYSASVALLLYTYYFSVFGLVAQFLIVLLFYRRRLARFMVAIIGAGIALLPWLPALYNQIVVERMRTANPNAPFVGKFGSTDPTSLESIVGFLNDYTAGQPAFALLLAALGILLYAGTRASRKTWHWLAAALLWLLLTAALFFTVNLVIPVYHPRYPLYVLPALALLVGFAVYALREKRARLGLLGLVAAVGLVTHTAAFLQPKTPHEAMLRTIAERYYPGDRIWYNFAFGGLGSSLQEEVDYYLQTEFPQLKPEMFVWDAPNDYADVEAVPRVWDVRPYWIPVPDVALPELVDGRWLTETYSFDAYTVSLYEAPPQQAPTIFSSGEVSLSMVAARPNTAHRRGEVLRLKTWWQAETPLPLDYSYSLFLRPADETTVVAQSDESLTANELPTSGWQETAADYFVPLELTLPDDLPSGAYDLWLGIYYWENPERFAVRSDVFAVEGETSLVNVGRITVR